MTNANKKKIGSSKGFDLTLLAMVALIIVGFIFMHDLMGETLFMAPYWDSYTLQAMAWRDGHTYLDRNYEYLELAIYEGNYYVSFPPVPSLVVLPLTFIFGTAVPTNLLMLIYAVFTAVFCYMLLKRLNVGETTAAFLSVFYVFGSNLLSISLNGSVWWHAQMLCVLLCTAALYFAVTNRRILSYALIALSVGCRPFSILMFPLVFMLFYRYDKRLDEKQSFVKLALKQLPCLIIPVLVGLGYMLYNYIRFDDPLEFGHNYLPEFVNSEHGQFSIHYLLGNLYNLFIRPVTFNAKLGLEFTDFDGFMFYIANPIFLILIIRAISDIVNKRFDVPRAVVLIAILLNIICLCCHKTLGGWQFGARYTVEMLPMALLYFILPAPVKNTVSVSENEASIEAITEEIPTKIQEETQEIADIPETTDTRSPELYTGWNPAFYEKVICILGIMFNLYGAVYFWIVNY